MEVHHHPHVEKKSFKEYLLEGLMIFLAVSMGFIAENIRENIVEHEIEKRNMELIENNLKEDTASLGKIIINKTNALIIFDSILQFRNKNLNDSNTFKSFYSFWRPLQGLQWFESNQSGFEQMKSSGSLRFVKKKQILDSLYRYENAYKIIESNEDSDKDLLGKARELGTHFMVFDKMHPQPFNVEQQKDAVNSFFNNYYYVYRNYESLYIPQMQNQLESGKRLIKQLKEEYHIENE